MAPAAPACAAAPTLGSEVLGSAGASAAAAASQCPASTAPNEPDEPESEPRATWAAGAGDMRDGIVIPTAVALIQFSRLLRGPC